MLKTKQGGRTSKTTTQGASDTDKDIKEEVEKWGYIVFFFYFLLL
jgi:hypothetical protein